MQYRKSLFLKKNIYLKVRVTAREREREREWKTSHLLIYSSNGCNSQDWTRQTKEFQPGLPHEASAQILVPDMSWHSYERLLWLIDSLCHNTQPYEWLLNLSCVYIIIKYYLTLCRTKQFQKDLFVWNAELERGGEKRERYFPFSGSFLKWLQCPGQG